MEDTKFVSVKTFTTRIDAELARGMLASNGIPSYIHADDAGGMQPFPGSYSSTIKLMVNKTDLSKAEKLMKLHRYI